MSGLGVRPKPTPIEDGAEHRMSEGVTRRCHIQNPNVRSCQEVPAHSQTTASIEPTVPPGVTLRLALTGLLVLAACQRTASPAPGPARCGPAVPRTAMHPIALHPALLAGYYELIQVQSQPISGVVTSGRLHLAPQDSVSKAGAVGGAVRDLIGWLDFTGGDPAWRAAVSSHDPARPGAVLTGQHLRLGQASPPDGMVHLLTITAVSAEGFWGWWKADRGVAVSTEPGTDRVLPDPAGYFCALRDGR